MSPARHGSAIGQALILLVAITLGAAVFVLRGKPQVQAWAVGKTVEAKFTLLTSDRFDLDCVYPKELPAGTCAYKKPDKRFSRSAAPSLKPYVTVTQKMVLLPNLFDRPDIRERYRKEPPAGRPRKALKRFAVTCDIELVDQPDGVRVRFGRRDKWSNPLRTWVGKIHDCKLQP
jgi:hypothetical protein